MKLFSGGVLFRRTKKVHWPTGLAPEMECLEALWIGTGFGIMVECFSQTICQHRLPDVMSELRVSVSRTRGS